jgi:hypothetical protein
MAVSDLLTRAGSVWPELPARSLNRRIEIASDDRMAAAADHRPKGADHKLGAPA